MVGYVLTVVGQAGVEQRVHARARDVRAMVLERRVEHRAYAVPDPAPGHGLVHERQSGVREDVVQRAHEVGGGVDQRAVEVEKVGRVRRGGTGHYWISARMASSTAR